jgi:hypothetical protein
MQPAPEKGEVKMIVRAGLTTKICVALVALGKPVRFILTPARRQLSGRGPDQQFFSSKGSSLTRVTPEIGFPSPLLTSTLRPSLHQTIQLHLAVICLWKGAGALRTFASWI